MKRNKQLERN